MIKKKAFTMIELLVGLCIFALAILPLVWLGSRQTSNAYSVGKHMMAGQLAASYMDNLLKRAYEDLPEISLEDEKVLDFPPDKIDKAFDLKEMINKLEESSDEGIRSAVENMNSSFRYFKCSISIKKTDNKIAIINVIVSYRVDEGKEGTEQSVSLTALKHGEK